jgi:hypothetical protein
MLTIPGHKGNANQNYTNTSLLLELLLSRTAPTKNVVKDEGKKETSHNAGGNINYYNHYGKQYGGFLKNKHSSAI